MMMWLPGAHRLSEDTECGVQWHGVVQMALSTKWSGVATEASTPSSGSPQHSRNSSFAEGGPATAAVTEGPPPSADAASPSSAPKHLPRCTAADFVNLKMMTSCPAASLLCAQNIPRLLSPRRCGCRCPASSPMHLALGLRTL